MTEKAARIGWIRHGVTAWNQLGKIQGVTDIPLSPEGLEQAGRLADRLAREGMTWNGVLCSDLTRAVQTGEIIAQRLGIPLRRDRRLRERFFGEAEGTTEPERLARWGPNWRRLVTDQESDELISARGCAFVEELTLQHPGEDWLVVTHGSFLARVLQSMCNNLVDSHLLNVSLTILEKQEQGWIPLLHNCTAHLDIDRVEASE
jgi:probable phosphoglycerate mutase